MERFQIRDKLKKIINLLKSKVCSTIHDRVADLNSSLVTTLNQKWNFHFTIVKKMNHQASVSLLQFLLFKNRQIHSEHNDLVTFNFVSLQCLDVRVASDVANELMSHHNVSHLETSSTAATLFLQAVLTGNTSCIEH